MLPVPLIVSSSLIDMKNSIKTNYALKFKVDINGKDCFFKLKSLSHRIPLVDRQTVYLSSFPSAFKELSIGISVCYLILWNSMHDIVIVGVH